MRTIHKYSGIVNDLVEFVVPSGARILDVQMQHELLAFWFLVDTEAPVQHRRFRVFGTGHPFDLEHPYAHVGTVHDPRGFVWHVFEVIRIVGAT